MRIGIFTNNYKPLFNGVVVSINNFRKGLEKLGHRVFLFAPNFKGYEEEQGDKVLRYPSVSLSSKAQYPLPLPNRKAKKFVKENKIDLIHAQHPWGMGGFGLRLGRKLGIPVVFTNHARYEFYVDYLPRILPRSILVKMVTKAATKFANKVDLVIAPTNSIKDYLVQNGVKKELIRVLPSGIDHSVIKKAPAAGLRKRYKIPRDHKLLLYFGRVGPEKNLPVILEAYKLILEKEDKVTLIMAGGTKGAEEYAESLQKMAKDMGIGKRVYFTGLVDPSKRGGYFREGDVFIHSSLSETQGLIMVDSMIAGTPVAAIRASGVVDVLTDGKDAVLTENSAEALAKGVLKMLKDEKLRKKLSKGALETAKEYSIPAVTVRLEKVYKEALGEN